eukprot:6574747-Prymnesium_polylepis.1
MKSCSGHTIVEGRALALSRQPSRLSRLAAHRAPHWPLWTALPPDPDAALVLSSRSTASTATRRGRFTDARGSRSR